MEYDFREIEGKWQKYWNQTNAYRVSNDPSKPKCYVLDMFPYPSGAGLHVGHPLGYIASDIYARYKRSKGFNVLHPMGYDSFGLPAEQYALETGQHPAVTTANNINTFRKQLDKIGLCFDWSREVRTSDPSYYRWTQWIFLQLFKSWYNRETDRAEPIETLIPKLEGFDALTKKQQADLLMNYRLAYCSFGEVNWCEALGTVLANDEVVNGVSERGGYPVVKKKLRQWYLRITEYADRLLEGLDRIAFSEAMKDMQTNWIGKSSGAEIDFAVKEEGADDLTLRVYTTRPDTIFGVDFMVIAPEHGLVERITRPAHRKQVEEYVAYVKSRSERERMAEKKISGVFTGAYALNPFDNREIPVWVSEYVLAGYGTGAIMAVPCGDERDHRFAKHFGIPITNIIGDSYNGEDANPTKHGVLQNSGFLDGLQMPVAMEAVIERLEKEGKGMRKVNYKMRDAAFSRQRYWGEPFPIQWEPVLGSEAGNAAGLSSDPVSSSIAVPLDEMALPLQLPEVDTYAPGPNGEGPLANIPEWTARHLETNTMPGYAGSSWYFLRYMDPHNDREFCSRNASDYWGQVDLYIGGTEHAVGHLLYSRMWTKVLYDLGHIGFDEPFKKLVNQGMIQGSSRFVYRVSFFRNDMPANERLPKQPLFISKSWYDKFDNHEMNVDSLYEKAREVLPGLPPSPHLVKQASEEGGAGATEDSRVVTGLSLIPLYVNVNIVDGTELDVEAFRKEKNGEYADAVFLLEKTGRYICGSETEKMSKSKFNTVNPDDLVNKYGADTFRMYEMFLGPIEMSKPWDTKGIEGVHRFIKKLWRLFFDEAKGKIWNEEPPEAAEWKALHRTIRKAEEDNERFSFNTGVSSFMICVNELHDLKCHKKDILIPLLVLIAPYAPHVTQELWSLTGNEGLILDAPYPAFEEKFLSESSKTYPLSVNGKVRDQVNLPLNATQEEVEKMVMGNPVVLKWLEGRPFRKVIYIKGKMINVVV